MERTIDSIYGKITYDLVYKNNKNMYARIKNGRIVVTASPFFPVNKVDQFVISNYLKLSNTIKSISVQSFNEFDKVMLLGQTYQIVYTDKKAYIEDRYIYLDGVDPRRSLQDFYMRQAQIYFMKRVNYFTDTFSYFPKPIVKLRYMRTMFGNCYFRQNIIKLNPILMKYDSKVIDSVIVHELCHFLVPNHSKDFYNHVYAIMPDYKLQRQKLRKERGIL